MAKPSTMPFLNPSMAYPKIGSSMEALKTMTGAGKTAMSAAITQAQQQNYVNNLKTQSAISKFGISGPAAASMQQQAQQQAQQNLIETTAATTLGVGSTLAPMAVPIMEASQKLTNVYAKNLLTQIANDELDPVAFQQFLEMNQDFLTQKNIEQLIYISGLNKDTAQKQLDLMTRQGGVGAILESFAPSEKEKGFLGRWLPPIGTIGAGVGAGIGAKKLMTSKPYDKAYKKAIGAGMTKKQAGAKAAATGAKAGAKTAIPGGWAVAIGASIGASLIANRILNRIVNDE